jgi:hypothetical protein
MRIEPKSLLRLLVVSVALAGVNPARGQGVPGYPDDVRAGFDPREVAMLPRYCIYTQLFRDNVPGGRNPDEIKRWTAMMGPTFNHVHHYCWGLMKTNRALLLVRTQRFRDYYLDDAIREFDYVINRAASDFKLLPEIITKKGENLLRLGRTRAALVELERVVALKPDYWPPYAAMSDHYKDAGDLAKARHWLEAGLAHAPEVNALKRRLAEIDNSRRESAAR